MATQDPASHIIKPNKTKAGRWEPEAPLMGKRTNIEGNSELYFLERWNFPNLLKDC